MADRRRRFGIARLLVAGLVASAAAGCFPTQVEGWTVACEGSDRADCEGAAALALNNLAWRRPDRPTGVITVRDRGLCPPVPDWADGSRCWDVLIPLRSGEPPACLVVARAAGGGAFGQVAGDDYSGRAQIGPPPPPGCP